MFWAICERTGYGSGTGAFQATFRDQTAAHQINSLAFAFFGEK
jgi:hypothetical protein